MSKSRSVTVYSCLLAVGLSLQFFSPVTANASPEYLIKFATVAPEGSTWMKHMRALDKEVMEKSGGRLGFRIYAGGIVGDELDVLKKIRIGQIHCAAFTGVGFGHILPMVRVMDLPFLFRNDEEVDLVHRELRPFFAEQFRKKGFELLGWAEVGNVNLFSKQPIREVRDLSGLKVWTWSGDPIAKETFVAMGINPIPLAITDVTTALSTGMIDTVYAPPLGALALQWQTSLKYMMALPLVHSTGAVLISSNYIQKLPPDLRELLISIFDKAMKELMLDLRRQNTEAIKIIQDSGLEIISMPKGEALKEFYAVHVKVAEHLTNKIYPKELLERVYKILNRS
ncbi:MAG: TRAP transporter substrate-binding protein DctP [Pseudomonadota bacterium]